MSERVTTARVRELRDAATPGPWEHEHIGYGGQEVTMDARHSVFVDGRGNAALIAAAPDLAADLLDARDDIGARDRLLDLTERRCAEAMVENARLRAIVEGRTVAPTRADVAQHARDHGGYWLVSRVNDSYPRDESWRPMVLRVLDSDFGPTATIPGIGYGGAWSDDPWRLMQGATWTPLAADGRLLSPAPREPAADDVARDAPEVG